MLELSQAVYRRRETQLTQTDGTLQGCNKYPYCRISYATIFNEEAPMSRLHSLTGAPIDGKPGNPRQG